MQKKQVISVQDWLPFEKILENGIIKLKDNSYVKIMKITPVNFNLKSSLEKEAILNSYKIFLQTIEFDIQILIQSNKDYILFNFYINSQSLQISGNDWYYYLSN